jgi:glucose/arabinose dehydrogenase
VPACGEVCSARPGGAVPPRRDLWAWGFRNPWRLGFDPVTGDLWAADVGEVTYEEISIVRRGRHHGWPWREGGRGWPPSQCEVSLPGGGDCVDPVYFCGRGAARGGVDGDCASVTGGAFAESDTWPADQRGRYWFADNGNGRFWSMRLTPARDGLVPGSRVLVREFDGGPPVSIRNGPDGALYLVLFSGRIVRYGPPPAPAPSSGARPR